MSTLRELYRDVDETLADLVGDAIKRSPEYLSGPIYDLIAPHVRREFLSELRQRARDDGFDFFSNYNAIPEPPSDEYTDVDQWINTLIKEEG